MATVQTRAAVLALLSSFVAYNACKKVDAQKGATSQPEATARTNAMWTRDSTLAKDSAAAHDAEQLAVDAYVYGYPLVMMDQMRRVMTNVATGGETRAPMGQFANMTNYPDPSFRAVATPSASMLYSLAWLDLASQPYELSVPDEHGRYYVMSMLSGWRNVFESPGARTARPGPQRYVIVGPTWKGSADTLHATLIRSPTNLVWVVGRTAAEQTPQDMQAARELQRQYTLVPLGANGRPRARSPGRVDPSIDMKTPVPDQVNALDAATFFNRLAMLMKDNPPAPSDSVIVAEMATIGIVVGHPFDLAKLGVHAADILRDVPRLGIERIAAAEKKAPIVNGWISSTNLASYDGQTDFRAYFAIVGLDMNLPKDVVHEMTRTDVTEHPLEGSRRYVLHFGKGDEPPVKAFWSVTVYDSNHFLPPNVNHRYEISPKRASVTHNPDGSLDIYVQHDPISGPKESNWLPAPTGHFYLVLRMHSPSDTVIGGGWKPPGVVEVGTPVWEK
jgi:hypothetical protein